jgi:hypothetical protein
MRFTIAAIAVLFVSAVAAAAEGPSAPPVDENALNRNLLERIARLERRVAELEAKLARAYTPGPQPYAPGELQRDAPTAPNDASRLPYEPTHSAPRHGDAKPPTPSDRVPDNWRRYEFNGHYYYLIPVGSWEPGTTQSRSTPLFPAQAFPANGDQPVRASANK